MHPTMFFLKLTRDNGNALLVNPNHIIAVVGGKDNATVYLIGDKNYTVTETVDAISGQFSDWLGTERAAA